MLKRLESARHAQVDQVTATLLIGVAVTASLRGGGVSRIAWRAPGKLDDSNNDSIGVGPT
jgi:hypothetical protein